MLKEQRNINQCSAISSFDTDAAVRDEFLIRLEQIRKTAVDEQKKYSCDMFRAMIASELRFD